MRAVAPGGILFDRDDSLAPRLRIDGQVAMKAERLSGQAGTHECQEHCAGPDQRGHPDAVFVGECHDGGAGVGNHGAARFGDESDIRAGEQRGEQSCQIGGAGVFVQFAELHVADRRVEWQFRQDAAGGTGILGDEPGQSRNGGQGVLRQAGVQVTAAERHGHEVERAARRAHFVSSTGIPCRARRSVRAMSGRPMRAVGSGPSMAAMRAMPSPSAFALPAQSSGCSMAT
jgi:hypothetical protein